MKNGLYNFAYYSTKSYRPHRVNRGSRTLEENGQYHYHTTNHGDTQTPEAEMQHLQDDSLVRRLPHLVDADGENSAAQNVDDEVVQVPFHLRLPSV